MTPVHIWILLVFCVGVLGHLSQMRRPARSFAPLADSDTLAPIRSRSGTQRIGRIVRNVGRRAPDEQRDLVVGRIAGAAAVSFALHPLIGVVVAAGLHVADVATRSRLKRATAERLNEGLAEVVDLFSVALRSGHNVASAVHQVARWNEGPVGASLLWVQQQVRHGKPLSDALEALPTRVGPEIRPLVAALVAHERYGSPISESLRQLAVDYRSERRRQAESAARRLPVTLLFPLVTCVLPAFLLLTVVPVMVKTLSGFGVFA